jgi:hypothetical protein
MSKVLRGLVKEKLAVQAIVCGDDQDGLAHDYRTFNCGPEVDIGQFPISQPPENHAYMSRIQDDETIGIPP